MVVLTNFCRSLDLNGEFFLYDSFNDDSYATHDIIKEFLKFLNDDEDKFSVNLNKIDLPTTQNGLNDCGLFALAYVFLIMIYEEPAICSIDQYSMRRLYNRFVNKEIKQMFFIYDQIKNLKLTYKKFEIQLFQRSVIA